MEKYDLVVLGATFLSLGLVKGYKGKSLIIESKAKPGYEFIDAFYNGENYENKCETAEGKAFKEYFEKAELLKKAFIPEWTAFVSDYICKNNIPVLLFTNVLKIEDTDNCKKLTIFNSAGKSEILAEKIIDTRTNSFEFKTLNAVVYGDEIATFDSSMTVVYTDGKVHLIEFKIPNGYDYPEARNAVYTIWAKRPEKLRGTQIAAVADVFFEKSDIESFKIDEKHSELYSTYYENPFIAFDNGCKIGGMLCD